MEEPARRAQDNPFDRFKSALKHVLSVSKEDVQAEEKRERQERQRERKARRLPRPA